MSGFVWSIKLGVEQGQKVIGSWEKKGTLREVQSVAPVGQSCAPVCISECVPDPTHCYGIPLPERPGICIHCELQLS